MAKLRKLIRDEKKITKMCIHFSFVLFFHFLFLFHDDYDSLSHAQMPSTNDHRY